MVKTGVVFRRGATVASLQGTNNDPPQQPAWRSKLTTPQNGLSAAPATTPTATASQSGKAGQRPLSLYVTGSGNNLSSFISKMQEKEGNRAVSPTVPTATTSSVVTPVSNQPVIRSVTPRVLSVLHTVSFCALQKRKISCTAQTNSAPFCHTSKQTGIAFLYSIFHSSNGQSFKESQIAAMVSNHDR